MLIFPSKGFPRRGRVAQTSGLGGNRDDVLEPGNIMLRSTSHAAPRTTAGSLGHGEFWEGDQLPKLGLVSDSCLQRRRLANEWGTTAAACFQRETSFTKVPSDLSSIPLEGEAKAGAVELPIHL